MNGQNKIYPIVIIGAGPAGLTAALYAQKLGIDFLLIDKHPFPKDKICGDALAPPVFSILEELGCPLSDLATLMYAPEKIIFAVIHSNRREELISHFSEHSKAYNSRRVLFDTFMFSRIKNKNQFLEANVKGINPDGQEIEVQLSGGEKAVFSYNHLIVATGSGKALWGNAPENNQQISMASRFYVKSHETKQDCSYIEFEESINPGYFWVFPLGDDTYNTGVLLHNKTLFHNIYSKTELLLKYYFGSFDIISRDKFPLRIAPYVSKDCNERIAIIGDAHHNIDPFFGHGIDTGMLEAREHLRSIYHFGRLAPSTTLLNLIENKNRFSSAFRLQFQKTGGAKERMEVFQNFLVQMSMHYKAVIEEIQQNSISNDKLTPIHSKPTGFLPKIINAFMPTFGQKRF